MRDGETRRHQCKWVASIEHSRNNARRCIWAAGIDAEMVAHAAGPWPVRTARAGSAACWPGKKLKTSRPEAAAEAPIEPALRPDAAAAHSQRG